MNAADLEILQTLTPTEAGIVKAAAAETFAAERVRPSTAGYVFDRFVAKQAAALNRSVPSPRAIKLASELGPVIASVRQATA